MIQIDDAGSGSLIGETAIGLYCHKTGKYEFDTIPIRYYQSNKLYQKKEYQKYIIKICKRVLEDWQVEREEVIEVCPSYIFEQLREWLSDNNFNWKTGKITGPLQEKLSVSFREHVISLGLPEKYLKHTKYAYGLHHLLKWVYADKDNREKHCKTCWKSYQKWGYQEINYIENEYLEEEQLCLKCGEVITDNYATVITYESKKRGKIYIHNICRNLH
ncbi:hypothetical protein GGQ84_001880 [Desulfitispora alkaliphila]|uniref:hypothetical protein n=1 Tax=Desulfitispora alkaliphila TaxID=622674 RepID=UPI003D1C0981